MVIQIDISKFQNINKMQEYVNNFCLTHESVLKIDIKPLSSKFLVVIHYKI